MGADTDPPGIVACRWRPHDGRGAGAQFALSKFRDSAEGVWGFAAEIIVHDDPKQRFV